MLNNIFIENIKISLQSVRSHLLRTILTILIIAIGIMALVGILTAIDAIKGSISSNFTSMGANTFTIRNRGTRVNIGKKGKRPKKYRPITWFEAERFAREFRFPSTTSVSTMATFSATIKFQSKKTNPNITVFGVDEHYLATSGNELSMGRNFTTQEILHGAHLVLIGNELYNTLFPRKEDPVGKQILIGSGKYTIIGVIKERGSSMGFGGDKTCSVPLDNVRQYFSKPEMTYTINVLARNPGELIPAIGEANGVFRRIRKVRLGDEDNFEITKSDSLATLLIKNLSFVSIAATVIGLITLLGAAIGLMNIMLVSVTERTREIGIRKATGATKSAIKNQFLAEAIVICQLGGFLGIILGIGAGNLISIVIGGGFIIPWFWIIAGVILCFLVGLVSGIYPAIKASNLDPVDALRFE